MTSAPPFGEFARPIAAALGTATSPLFALDFDGTLAPLVARPEWAQVPEGVARTLARLALRHPVAIITGRTIDDVRPRLGFEPWAIVGSHGAEWADDHAFGTPFARRLDIARLALLTHADALFFAGDDSNDDPVFETAEASWQTVRVGTATSAAACYTVDTTEAVQAAAWRSHPMTLHISSSVIPSNRLLPKFVTWRAKSTPLKLECSRPVAASHSM